MSTETENFKPNNKSHVSISRVDHCTSIMKSVDDIFQKQLFTDVCLSCENQIINAHRLILAASCSFFHSLFSQKPCSLNANPVIVIRGMKINELKAILEFIYYGNLVVPESDLNSLIASAESLGVYGLSKLGKIDPDSLNESKDDDQQQPTEINNNEIETQTNSSAKNKNQQTNRSLINKEQSPKNNNQTENRSNQQQISSNKVQDKTKRKVLINNSKQTPEIDDLEEKRKKKEIINQTTKQTTTNKTVNQTTDQTSPIIPTTSLDQQTQNTDQQQQSTSSSQQSASSKRQSLRLRDRKNNSDPTKEQNDLLNTSNNSEFSSSSTSNGKKLKRTDSDSQIDELMSFDESEPNSNKKDSSTNDSQQIQNDNQETDPNNDLLLVNRIAINKTLKLKRNKHSILRKQVNEHPRKQFKLLANKNDSEIFNLMSKRQSDESNSQSNQVLSDDEDKNADLTCEENIVLKKLDSPTTSGSLNASRKNSLDSNIDNESLIKLSKNDRSQNLNESTTSTGNQSLLAKQNQKKKRRRTSIDSNS